MADEKQDRFITKTADEVRFRKPKTKPAEPTRHSEDAQGHQHKGPGEGGGQFTGSGAASGATKKLVHTANGVEPAIREYLEKNP